MTKIVGVVAPPGSDITQEQADNLMISACATQCEDAYRDACNLAAGIQSAMRDGELADNHTETLRWLDAINAQTAVFLQQLATLKRRNEALAMAVQLAHETRNTADHLPF